MLFNSEMTWLNIINFIYKSLRFAKIFSKKLLKFKLCNKTSWLILHFILYLHINNFFFQKIKS